MALALGDNVSSGARQNPVTNQIHPTVSRTTAVVQLECMPVYVKIRILRIGEKVLTCEVLSVLGAHKLYQPKKVRRPACSLAYCACAPVVT